MLLAPPAHGAFPLQGRLSRIRTAVLGNCPTTHAPILVVKHVKPSVFPLFVQVNSTDGAGPTHVVHTTFCPGAPQAVVDPQAGTAMPAPLSWVHWRDSTSAIGSEALKPENDKTPAAITPNARIMPARRFARLMDLGKHPRFKPTKTPLKLK